VRERAGTPPAQEAKRDGPEQGEEGVQGGIKRGVQAVEGMEGCCE
jgi:hypothetical protein